MPHRLAGPLPRLSLAALLLLPSLALAAQLDPSSDPDPQTALEQGNRHFRAGRLEEALSSYRAGWDPRHPHPILAYNLGTTAHHLGQLPEAVLWYRRAIRIAGDGDVWLTENLARARERLAAPRWPPSGLLAWLARQRSGLWILGALAGWTALGLLLSRRTALRRPADLLVLLAACWGSAYTFIKVAVAIGLATLCEREGLEQIDLPTDDTDALVGLDLAATAAEYSPIAVAHAEHRQLAALLHVSQAYLCYLEKERVPVNEKWAAKLRQLGFEVEVTGGRPKGGRL